MQLQCESIVHVACVPVAFGRLLVDRLDSGFHETVEAAVTIKGHSEIAQNEFAEAVSTIPEVLAAQPVAPRILFPWC